MPSSSFRSTPQPWYTNLSNQLSPDDMRHRRGRVILNSLGPAGDRSALVVYAEMEPYAEAYGSRKEPYVACTTGLLALLNTEETKAIFAHEVTHVWLGHTSKRWWNRLPGGTKVRKWKLVKVAAAFHSRHVELVTDANITRLGADPLALRSALRKIRNNWALADLSTWQHLTTGTHPRHGRRFRLLERHARRLSIAASGGTTSSKRRVSPLNSRQILGR